MQHDPEHHIRAIRGAYLDKYDGLPPYRGDAAYALNIRFLENELARVRVILEKIESETCVMGSDGGHSGVEKLAQEGLKIPI